MSKVKILYACQQCGGQFPKWMGQCTDCGAWNSLQEQQASVTVKSTTRQGFTGITQAVTRMGDVQITHEARTHTGLDELDRVLGGGLVAGSVVLLGGDPGIGKSTLLLQTMCQLNQQGSVLYVTGEESLQQVTMRARRLKLASEDLQLLTETHLETILALAEKNRPEVIVIDSIQTMFTDLLPSAPGSVSQVREVAAKLVAFAKQTNTALFLIGHVTKEGALAGPRVLEHMVDTVLYFEGQTDNRYRVIRAVKNRFGAVNEIGVFAMTEAGLREVNNPSAIFLSREDKNTPGSVIMATWEGTRPLLIEVQALVDESHLANPRRVCVGLDHNRLAMLLAVLHKHAGVVTYNQDVFINVVGGMKVTETAIDLPILLAVVSSLRNQSLPQDLVVFGELGLSGEIRPVQSGQERLQEAAKLGFQRAIVPKANVSKRTAQLMSVTGVTHIVQALEILC
jgi:DNA repair protein RadA/Sms